MPILTRQIIRDVVKEEIGSALKPLEQRFDGLEQKINGLDQKVDTVITQLTDIAGQFKKFDEEQTGSKNLKSPHSAWLQHNL